MGFLSGAITPPPSLSPARGGRGVCQGHPRKSANDPSRVINDDAPSNLSKPLKCTVTVNFLLLSNNGLPMVTTTLICRPSKLQFPFYQFQSSEIMLCAPFISYVHSLCTPLMCYMHPLCAMPTPNQLYAALISYVYPLHDSHWLKLTTTTNHIIGI